MDSTDKNLISTIVDVINGKKSLPEIAFGIDTPTLIKTGAILMFVFGVPLWGMFILKLSQKK